MLVTMSNKELHRLPVIQTVVEKRLRRRDAASQLDLTERQVQRLMNRFRKSGPVGLTNTRRGMPGTHHIDAALRHRILTLLRENYVGFVPIRSAEKLQECHGIVSVETLRCWMTADGLWVPHAHRRPRVYQPRYRRDCLGELIQIDGSHHDWFEGRAPKCCLLVFIDDATGRLMHLRFSESEIGFDYMLVTQEYIEQHGQPVSLYSDKHAIFRASGPENRNTTFTQFGRLLYDLVIELICANSSEAKGRVERANETLQDRVIKEIRLEGITGIDAVNAWLATFIADINSRFSRPARFPKNLYRTVQESPDELRDIFAQHDVRTVSKSLIFQYDKILYLRDPTEKNSRFAGEKIKVLDYPDGAPAFHYGHRSLGARHLISWPASIRGR